MHADWQNFLKNEGATFKNEKLLAYTNEYKSGQSIDNIITDLSHLALIEVSGDDVIDFLNKQFTTNIKKLAKHQLQFCAWCNPKGQVKITFFIYRHETGCNILLPAELQKLFIEQIKMYIMRENVKLIDKSNELVRVGIQTNDNRILAKFIEPLPKQEGDITIQNNLHCLRVFGSRNNSQRYIFIGSVERLTNLWKELLRHVTPVETSIWKLLDIQAAYPWIGTQTAQKFLPQILNLDLINGLDYQKGCYPGQEIIARAHFRGQLKRCLYLATCTTDTCPENNDSIISSEGNNVGTIINTQVFSGKHYLLAVIEKKLIGNILSIHDPGGPKISVETLPYNKQ